MARKSVRPVGVSRVQISAPRLSSAARRSGEAAEVVTITKSWAALVSMRQSRGSRSWESTTMRRKGRLRGRPLRSLSMGLSANTVPMPVRMTSC